MTSATITAKGQITIPKIIRDLFGLSTGDQIIFEVDAEQHIATFKPFHKSLDDVLGMMSHRAPEKPLKIEDLKKAVARQFRKKKQ